MKITPRKYAQALAQTLESSRDRKNVMASFLSMLRRRKHFRLLPKILQAFENEWNAICGVVKIEVTYPVKLKESLNELQKRLEAHFGKVDAVSKPSDTLIGGFSVRFGDTLIDASVEGKLRKLAAQLSN